jgi:hypothetical protein
VLQGGGLGIIVAMEGDQSQIVQIGGDAVQIALGPAPCQICRPSSASLSSR